MPKPIVGDNGIGMHVHQSICEGRQAAVRRRQVRAACRRSRSTTSAASSSTRRRSTRSRTPATNSYKRLVPGFEAPVMLAYSARNRSASIRIPLGRESRRAAASRCASRIRPRIRTSRFAAMLMAGIDGIQNKIHPGDPADKDLLRPAAGRSQAHSRRSATRWSRRCEALDADRGFLKAGGVFTDDVIDAYIALKMQEVTKVRMSTHPLEFEIVLQRVIHTAYRVLRPGTPSRAVACGDGGHTRRHPFLSPIGEAAYALASCVQRPAATARASRLPCSSSTAVATDVWKWVDEKGDHALLRPAQWPGATKIEVRAGNVVGTAPHEGTFSGG